MQTKEPLRWQISFGILALFLAAACAGPSYIPVRYQLAPKSNALHDQRVFLTVTDARSDQRIFDAAARQEFEKFNGYFALSLAYGDEKGLVDGTYDLPALFKAALRHRLQNTGVTVLSVPDPTVPTMVLQLNEFLLSLQKSKWIATIGYKVSLSKDPQTVVSDTISGSAERVKIVGSGGAEKILGEIFSDSLNRLDVAALFAKAGL